MKAWVATVWIAAALSLHAQKIDVDWGKVVRTSVTTPTLQVVVNPPLRRGSAIHDRAFKELKNLGADYVRYVPWFPYPRLGVAELDPPANGKTSWDFSLVDPLTVDFLKATADQSHSVVLNFSTIPAWLFVTPKPVEYPQDPNQPDWNYNNGTELRDPSMKELGDYYARLVSWYVNGGFTDEFGKHHKSGHHFKIPYWEVLNEADSEHNMTPEQYTQRYDAIVTAIQSVAPQMKFVGLSLAFPSNNPKFFEYFLNLKNHRPGIPLDMISYHFYATPTPDESMETQEHTFFDQADRFLATVRYIEMIRQRLSPTTRTTINEIGSISADDGLQTKKDHVTAPIPPEYWRLSGGTYAYLFGNLAAMGIDVLGESQLVGYPTQYPSVSMLDWNTGAPNARFRVLQLLKDNFHPGDKIVPVKGGGPYVYFFAVITSSGEHKVLIVNRRNRDTQLTFGQEIEKVQAVNAATGDGPHSDEKLNVTQMNLSGLATVVATLKQ